MTLSDNFNAFWVNFNLKMLGDKNVVVYQKVC